MTQDERFKRFLPYWIIRVVWLLVLFALTWQVTSGAVSPRLLAGFAIALGVQVLVLVLALLKRLPMWHDSLSAVVSAGVAATLLVTFPDQLIALLLLGLLPALDLARWRGWTSALALLLIFPIAPLLLHYVRDVPLATSATVLLAWLITVLFSIGVAGAPATRNGAVAERTIPETPSNILARGAQRLARDNNYDHILASLAHEGSALLDIGSRNAHAKAIALTFKPGLSDMLVAVALHNLEDGLKGRNFPARGVLGQLLNEGEPTHTTTNLPPFDEVKAFDDHHLLLFPLRTSLDVFGVVVFATRNRVQADDAEVRRTLVALTDQASLALHNSVLEQELRRDRTQRLVGEEESRHQLARQLHDGPIQRIAAITMQLEFIKALMGRHPDRAQAEIEQLQQAAKLASQEMRTMLFSLRPVVLESEGLVAALETYVQRVREQDRLSIAFQADPLPRLDPKIEEVAFAVMQEAIGNAKKYAGNANIYVRLIQGQSMLIGQVEDEGPGFDLEAVTASYGTRASLGLLNMQERAALVRGQLKIDTARGRGTIVSVALPIFAD